MLFALVAIYSCSKAGIDSTYIKSYPECLTLKGYLDFKSNAFFATDDFTGARIDYQTTRAPRLGAGFSYKWMSLASTFFPIYQIPNSEGGNGRQIDIQYNFYFKFLSSDIRLQNYKGYYLNNKQNILGLEQGKEYVRSDINATSIGLNVRYNFNWEKFSQKAVFSQTEKQLKNAGTWSVGLRWNALALEADSSFVPSNLSPNFIDFELKSFEIYDLGIGGGYAYSYIRKHWFFSFSFMPYLVLQGFKTQEEGAESISQMTSFQFIQQSRGAIGYSNHQHYYGITFVFDQMRSRWKNAHDIGYDFAHTKLIYAFRWRLKK